jgi:hypothetical protein
MQYSFVVGNIEYMYSSVMVVIALSFDQYPTNIGLGQISFLYDIGIRFRLAKSLPGNAPVFKISISIAATVTVPR